MKTLAVQVFSVLTIAALAVACSDYHKEVEYEKRISYTKYNKMRTIDGDKPENNFYLLCDEGHDIMYLKIQKWDGGITPFLDEDGSVIKCSEYRRNNR